MRRCGGRRAFGIDQGLVNKLIELAAVDYFDERSTFTVSGDDPNGRRVFNADALAESVVCLDGSKQFALGIDGKGQSDFAVGGKFAGERAERIEIRDGGLIGKDGIAIFIAELLAFFVEPASIDGCLHAPGMEGQREVVAYEGDFVVCFGLAEEGIGACAVGALHVGEFDDGDAGTRGRFECAGVMYLRATRRSSELGQGDRRCDQGNNKHLGSEEGTIGEARGEELTHVNWTAPFAPL